MMSSSWLEEDIHVKYIPNVHLLIYLLIYSCIDSKKSFSNDNFNYVYSRFTAPLFM